MSKREREGEREREREGGRERERGGEGERKLCLSRFEIEDIAY